MHKTRRHLSRHPGGFAVVLVVTLLAFLVLLVVSLSALTRVETRAADYARADALARQHATTALHLALGQLQKHAGPDARITASSELLSATHPHLTGVWDAPPNTAQPLTWLISGSEDDATSPAALLASLPNPSAETSDPATVFLVGERCLAADPSAPTPSEKARRIQLRKRDFPAPSAGQPPLGRYAWWIADEGQKASLALPDRADDVTYAPWTTPAQRQRLRQQLAGTPNYFRAANATTAHALGGMDPLSSTNLPLLPRVHAPAQLRLFAPAAGDLPAHLRAHHHDFTTVAHAVLANTRIDAHRGLLRDLSLAPVELGPAFVAYANYPAYIEAPGTTLPGADPAYPQITDNDSPRRRYRISAPTTGPSAPGLPDLTFGVAPVLTDFVLQFRFFRTHANTLLVRSRLHVSLWNPYTSALAPDAADPLTLEISGLPRVTVTDPGTSASTIVDLQTSLPVVLHAANGAMRVQLPFGNTLTTNGTTADRSSWLPGRVYAWTTESGATPTERLEYYTKTLNVAGWTYPAVPLAGSASATLTVNTAGAPVPGLTLRLSNTAGLLATYTTPDFAAVDATASGATWRFAFATRLRQPLFGDSNRTWLRRFDPRATQPPADAFGGFDPNQDIPPLDPNVYSSTSGLPTAHPSFLLYRIQGTSALSQSAYNDVPLFELPRLPHLSLGELQHLQIANTRPFALGNSWGGTANALFDRFFFSGLPATPTATSADPDLASGQPLPNWHLRPLSTSSTASLRAAGAFSSRHLLQAGAFNLNSTRPAAWRAMLSGARLAHGFNAAHIENTSGDTFGTQKTATSLAPESFDADTTLGPGASAPVFLRFPQSAQETYFWRPAPNSPSTDKRQLATHAFRLGLRGAADPASSPIDSSVTAHRLTTDQLETLAQEIIRLLKLRAGTAGPVRTLEEFLGPSAGPGTPSLLETALANSGLNPPEIAPLDHVAPLATGGFGAGFSSLTLTQADLLSAIASQLRARSDTFVIRAYGEALNPATGEPDASAWLEAAVQRFPETVDASDNLDQPTGPFGRRFKITSFRWLAVSDL